MILDMGILPIEVEKLNFVAKEGFLYAGFFFNPMYKMMLDMYVPPEI